MPLIWKYGHSTTGQNYSNKSLKIVLTYSIIAFHFFKTKYPWIGDVITQMCLLFRHKHIITLNANCIIIKWSHFQNKVSAMLQNNKISVKYISQSKV